MLAGRQEHCRQAYWAGNPHPEAQRLALRLLEEWAEDFFDSSADDVEATMRALDEQQRHTSG
jgi:hypothetical protein